MRRGLLLGLVLAASWIGFGMSFYGDWDFTLEILPNLRVYESELTLNYVFAPGWRIESESKIYSDGWRYQNFYIDGTFGDFDIWGKMYFHAQEVRYQKMWLNAEAPIGGGTLWFSFNHWAKRTDYSSSDRDMFGDWPCYVQVAAYPVIEAAELVNTWAGPTDPRIGQLYYVHGTVAGYYRTSTYVNLNLVYDYPAKRFIIYIRFADIPGGESAVMAKLGITSWPEVNGKELCVFGKLVNWVSPSGVNNPEIVLGDSPRKLDDLNLGQCVPQMIWVPWEGPMINWRLRYTLSPFTITADFNDCCEGTWFRQVKVELSDVFLCCGLFLDATWTFTKNAGLAEVFLSLGELPLPCCGMTATVETKFTPTSKTVSFKPKWQGISGCFTVYGDAQWSPNILQGIEIYGFGVTCYFDKWELRAITAFNPDKVEDLTDVTFYTDEWEYLSLTYNTSGCCGGSVEFQVQTWFGNQGILFGLQRVRFDLTVPITDRMEIFTKGQWNFAEASPLQWFDVGWSLSF